MAAAQDDEVGLGNQHTDASGRSQGPDQLQDRTQDSTPDRTAGTSDTLPQEASACNTVHTSHDPTPSVQAGVGADSAANATATHAGTDGGAEALSPEEEQKLCAAAEALKQEGNSLYAEGRFEEAQAKYWEALDTAPSTSKSRAVYYANLAACDLKLARYAESAQHCSEAIAMDASYVKAYMRRSEALEKLDDLDHSLADARKVAELDPSNTWASKQISKLEPIVTERQEKMKDEMMGKLKELGNNILGRFGLSLDNFKAEKDPATGSYSIKFQ